MCVYSDKAQRTSQLKRGKHISQYSPAVPSALRFDVMFAFPENTTAAKCDLFVKTPLIALEFKQDFSSKYTEFGRFVLQVESDRS